MIWLISAYIGIAIAVTLKCCDQCLNDHDDLDWQDKAQALGYGVVWPITAARAFFTAIAPRI